MRFTARTLGLVAGEPNRNVLSADVQEAFAIAVFGQGAIHNQWRLDHRNAMDISLNPDGAEVRR
jgi:hypothetical protein